NLALTSFPSRRSSDLLVSEIALLTIERGVFHERTPPALSLLQQISERGQLCDTAIVGQCNRADSQMFKLVQHLFYFDMFITVLRSEEHTLNSSHVSIS